MDAIDAVVAAKFLAILLGLVWLARRASRPAARDEDGPGA